MAGLIRHSGAHGAAAAATAKFASPPSRRTLPFSFLPTLPERTVHLYSRVVVWRATTLLTTERIVVPRRIYRTPLLTLPHSHAPRGGAQRGRHGAVPPRRPHNERRPLRRNAHYRSPHGLRFTPHLGCAVVRVRQSVHKIHSAEWLRLMLVAHGARTRRSVHPGPNPQVACRTPWPATTHMKRQHASVNAQRARTPSRVLCASEGVRAV